MWPNQLELVFAALASALWIVITAYSIGYMRKNNEPHQTRFYICFAIAMASTMGIAFAGNLITLFLFYEILTLSTYPLVVHHETDAARRAGRVYLGVLLSTSILFLLPAIIWTWFLTGTLDFTRGGILAGKIEGPQAAILFALFLVWRGQGGVDAVSSLAARGDGGAHAGQRLSACGGGGEGGGFHGAEGWRLYFWGGLSFHHASQRMDAVGGGIQPDRWLRLSRLARTI